MGSKVSTLTVSLKDDVSGKADKIGRALNKATDQARAMARAMEGSGASKGFTNSLTRLGLSARDIEKVSASLRDYAKAAGLSAKAADWTKAQTAQIRQWETATIASLRHVTAEQRAQSAAQLEAAVKAGQAQAAVRKAAETDTARTLERMARDKVAAERSAARDAATIARTAARDARSERLASAREERTEAARTARQKMQWAVEAGRQARRDREQGETEVQRRAEAQLQSRTDARRAIAGGVGLYTAHKVKEGTHATLETYREFDKERRFGKAVMGITDEEQKPLVDQAIHMGATTKYNDVQVLEAQRELAARGLKRDQVMGLMEPAANLGQSLDLNLPAAVKQMEGALFGFKKPIGTLEEAINSARQTADLQVKVAKVSGMTPEDITQAYKYAATPARMSGVSEEMMLAFAGISKKANMGGDESGVAFRALIASGISPTRKAKEAYLANGMDFKNYQKNPDSLALDPFVKNVAAQYGVKLDKNTRQGLGGIFGDKSLISDPAKFTPAVMKLLGDNLGGDDAKSKKSIAGAANRYRDASMKGVDLNALMADLMQKLPGNLQLANAIFGSKQGARIATALGDPEVVRHIVDELKNHSKGFAEAISKERMAGYDGAASRFEGAKKNLETALGRSLDDDGKGGFLTNLVSGAAKAVQALAELPRPALAAGSALAWLGGKASGAIGTAALVGAAFSLNASAGALTAAAARLGVGGALGAAGGLGGVAAGAGLTSLAIGTLAVGSIAVAGAITTALLIDGAESGKAIVHGGKPDAGQAMNPSDELPGLEGSNEKPTWAKPLFTMPKPLAPNSPAPAVVGKPSLDRKTVPLPPRRPERFGKGAVSEVVLPEQAVTAPAEPKGDTGYLERMHARANEFRAELEKIGGVNVQPTIATGSLDAVGQKAGETKQKIEEIGTVNVAPQIGMGNLDALASKAREVLSLLQQIPGAAAAAGNSAVNGIRARASSPSFSDGVTPGAGGP